MRGHPPQEQRLPANHIAGICPPGFELVERVFRHGLEQELGGGAVCVYLDGRKVIDLWGGFRDATGTKPWTRNTVSCVMSVTKAVAALGVLMLVERGKIQLDKPVALYWPEFSAGGKQDITVELLMAGRAGLIYADRCEAGAIYRWAEMAQALAMQEPAWPPGERGAYHSTTIGFLLGELIKRVDGRDIATFVGEEISAPLGVDFTFGVSEDGAANVAETIPSTNNQTLSAAGDGVSKLARAWKAMPANRHDMFNSEDWRHSVMPSGNGHSNARSLARIFAVLAEGGELDNVRFLSRELIRKARTVQWDGTCELTDRTYRYGLGFFLNGSPLVPMGPNEGAYGHPGLGGVLAFADPEARLSFSYTPNKMAASEGVGEPCKDLINALYDSL